MNILILGVNGFIGHHLSRRILETTDWRVFGMDRDSHRVEALDKHPRFRFHQGDITQQRDWIERHVRKCDVVLPLAAIATPATYVQDPLAVFELDFEANLPIIRACVRHRTRVLFPSTSEVYGMCPDVQFHPELSNFVLGPIAKPRWIYSCSKQLLDRVIAAYGQQQGLDYTLFRPFNWIGPGLDSPHSSTSGSARVVTQFLGHIARGEPIQLVDGGRQRRCFTDIADGIDALMRILANDGGRASGQIFNIGNPANDLSIRELAETMLTLADEFPEYARGRARCRLIEVTADGYYGEGYEDVQARTPWIDNTCQELGWMPHIDVRDALRRIFVTYRHEVAALADHATAPPVRLHRPSDHAAVGVRAVPAT